MFCIKSLLKMNETGIYSKAESLFYCLGKQALFALLYIIFIPWPAIA